MTELVTQAVDRLRQARVKLKRGLSGREISRIERDLDFTFGNEHRELLTRVLPIGGSWVDWRHGSLDSLRARLTWPVEGIVFDVLNNGFWPRSWGERPGDRAQAEQRARAQLASAPSLVPIYSHRYLAAGAEYAPTPVFSAHQSDVIYYGDNLLDYVAHEFASPPLHPSLKRTHVPFWSDLAEGKEAGDL